MVSIAQAARADRALLYRTRLAHGYRRDGFDVSVVAAPMNAHDVRKLRVCGACNGIGFGPHMVRGMHGACYVERRGVDELLALPPAETDGLTLGDIGPEIMRALMDA